MAIISMKKLTLVGYGKDKSKVLKCLHKLGCVEISRTEDLENTCRKEETLGKEEVGTKLNRLSFVFSFLKAEKRIADAKVKADQKAEKNAESLENRASFSYDAPKKQLFNPTPRFEFDEFNKIIEKEDELFREVAELEAINQRYVDIKSEIVKLQTLIEQVRIFSPLAVKLNAFKDTKNTSMILGYVPEQKAVGIEKIKADYNKLYVETVVTEGAKFYPVVLIVLKEEREEILARFNEVEFIRSSFTYDMTATEKVAEAKTKIAELNAETLLLLSRSMSKLSVLPDLKQLFDYYSIENAKLTASDSFAFTKTAFVLEGWIPKDEEPRVTDALRAISNAMVIETREPIAGDHVPTLTINNKIVSPYEAVTNMFSPPNPLTDIDPNPFVAFFYFIMFGMMMGDAVYGIVLALGGFLCYHFMKPVPGKGKLFLIIGMGGISTIIWGTLFGSWMALPIENTFLSKLVWFNPVDESGAILMLVVSLAIGIFQILFSMGIKMYMLFKAGQWVDAICDQGTWFLILFGLGFYAGAPALGAPLFLKTVGLVMLFAGLGIVILFGGRHKKGFKKITGGLGQLYGGVNILSDVLSYCRLFGLGLATGVIGMVVNNICSLIIEMMPAFGGVPVLGIVIAAPIFIIGHAFNIGINTLGTYIHDSRLQFIEFFSRFYEGGGHTFKPLGSNTKYTYIEK